jgi:hypothetical protein
VKPEIRTALIKPGSLTLNPWASLLRIDCAEASPVGGAGDERLPVRGDEVLAASVRLNMIAILLILFLANSTATVENSALFNMAGGHIVFYLSISLNYLTVIPGSITFVVFGN